MSGSAARTIMVVDDDGDIRESVRQILEDEGHQVVVASNGQEAIDLLRAATELPRLILLDLGMPIMSGWDFRRQQRSDPRLAAIPVVVITAVGDASAKARDLEPEDVLVKPFALAELLATVERY